MPAPTSKNVWDSLDNRRDVVLCSPSGCRVDGERWFRPQFSVWASLDLGRWSASATIHKTFTLIWLALWLTALDKSRSSSSGEVQEAWAVFDERLKVVDVASWEAINAGLTAGDPSSAWAACLVLLRVLCGRLLPCWWPPSVRARGSWKS